MEAYKSRKLRIVEPGLTNYTGNDFGVEFENGVSIEEVGWIEAARIGANIQIVDLEDEDYQINEVAETLRMRDLSADDQRVRNFDQAQQVDGDIKLGLQHLSRDELEAIADKEGLAGVRELARRYNRTGRSIQECINAVLEGQGEQKASEK